MGPGSFVPTNPDLVDILGRTDLEFENFYFVRFLDPKFLDFQVPRYLKSGLGRTGLGPWVGPWQCCAGARRRAAGAPAQHCHGPTQGPSPARPRPDLRYLGTWKSRSLESHGTLATKISEFWTYWNPCVKDFRILDLLEPLRQRFPDFQITPEILSIYGIIMDQSQCSCKTALGMKLQ